MTVSRKFHDVDFPNLTAVPAARFRLLHSPKLDKPVLLIDRAADSESFVGMTKPDWAEAVLICADSIDAPDGETLDAAAVREWLKTKLQQAR